MIERNEYVKLWKNLSKDKSLILMTGPRQSGKTTLAKFIQELYSNSLYFNWDIISNKRKIIENPGFFQDINRIDNSTPLIVFDEIHKYKNWKNYLKGIYDEFVDDYSFLVTGSARLDMLKGGGDSLAGRYFMFHLFPFTLSELSTVSKINITDKYWLKNMDFDDSNDSKSIWENLFSFSGFPEPFIKCRKSFYNKWVNTFTQQIVKEDIRAFSDIKNIDGIEILYSLLPVKTGSPFSINSIARDIQFSFKTIKNWLLLLEKVSLTFSISPWTKKISRSILKEKKWYIFNYIEIDNSSIRFENMVALELLRKVFYWNEEGKGPFTLHYLRDKEKREVDFLLLEKNEPILMIETKLNNDRPSPSLIYFQNRLNIPAVQLVNKKGIYKKIINGDNSIIVITAHRFLSSL